jgi:two-component system chemotaxis sensor kinase CheA
MTSRISPDVFLQEAREILTDIENIILDLEESPNDMDVLNRLFRSMHTIKGSGAMYGFDKIADFTHHVETVLDQVRSGKIPVSTRVIDLILLCRDHIQVLVDAPHEADAAQGEKLTGDLLRLLPDGGPSSPAADDHIVPVKKSLPSSGPVESIAYNILFQPDPAIMRSGMDPCALLNELRSMGRCAVTAGTDSVPPLKDMNPESCYLSWNIRLITEKDKRDVQDVFIFVEEDSQISIETINPAMPPAEASVPLPLPVNGRAEKPSLNVCAGKPAASIRISSEKLDMLINLVGELLITQERISSAAVLLNDVEKIKLFNMLFNIPGKESFSLSNRKKRRSILLSKFDAGDAHLDSLQVLEKLADRLAHPIESLAHLSTALRDCALSMRMVPIGTVFGQFRRLVRDLAADLGREVELITGGGGTELDKTMIERINDPLIHLIRNSIDHGILPPEERKKAGKPSRAVIRLSAAHQGANVVIIVEDDGKGLDPEVLRTAAIEKGLLPENKAFSEKELFNLIFFPGFSTAKTLSKVSGRGVGMDVVKREIEAIGGSVYVESRKEEYCRFTLSLPLTLAIINGLLVDICGTFFVLPLSYVVECVELVPELTEKSHGRDYILLREEVIPFLRLRSLFDMEGPPASKEHIAVIEFEGNRIGLLVDTILGDIQTVIKSLDRNNQQAGIFSGATVLGDGTVALVIDIPGVMRVS